MFIDKDQAVQDIKYIKEVMVTSSRYTHLSGLASICSGFAVLVGCIISHIILKAYQGSQEEVISKARWNLLGIWSGVFFLAIIANLFFTIRKANKEGEPAWSRLSRLILYAFFPPFFTGVLLTLFLYINERYMWIPGIWMLTYGLGVWSAGLFSIQEPRWLGASFLISGALTLLFWVPHSLVLVGISFGGFHLAYGLRLYLKYGG